MVKIYSKIGPIDEREVTAYVQQQMAELTPHLNEQTAVQVRLTPMRDGFQAELTARHSEGDIQTIGWNEDIFNAIKYAKEGLIEYFIEIEGEINSHLREEKIRHISRHGNLYLH